MGWSWIGSDGEGLAGMLSTHGEWDTSFPILSRGKTEAPTQTPTKQHNEEKTTTDKIHEAEQQSNGFQHNLP